MEVFFPDDIDVLILAMKDFLKRIMEDFSWSFRDADSNYVCNRLLHFDYLSFLPHTRAF